jgi:hypothetical protein
MSATHYSVFAMMQRAVARCKQLKPRRNTKSCSNQETRNVIVAIESEVCNSRMSDERWGILFCALLPLSHSFRQNVISCSTGSTGSAGKALGDVSCEWHLETHALKRFQHQDNPQNQSKEANEVQEERAQRERTPIAAPAKPPAYAKDRTECGLHNLQSEENDYGLRGVESHVRAPVKEEKDQACDPAQHVA